MRFGFYLKTLALLSLLTTAGRPVLRAEERKPAPDFREIFDLVREHVPGVSEADLDHAALEGVLEALGPKVSLVTNGAAAPAPAGEPILSKVSVLDEVAYLRVTRVAGDLAREVDRAYRQLASTNSLKGVVLDLRYAGGSDYAAAAATADLFVATVRPLLNWGNGVVSSQEKTNAIQLPVAVLVNGRTAGAAEALAAVLREAGAGLILGGKTAGAAMVTKDFSLKNGDTLRVAVAPITLGNGTSAPAKGLQPDIDVTVSPDEEHAYYADSFYMTRKTNALASVTGASTNEPGGTNGLRRERFNEAELVRQHREGLDRTTGDTPRLRAVDSEGTRARPGEPEKPMVSDPALARALDLLHGLAVVRQSRS